jgi:broad specificity phosphatase PhoE
MLLFLVRHAQSEANAKIRGAPIDCPLTDLGRRQAAAVARRLSDSRIDLVLASPYLRALETADIIRQATGVPAEIVPLLHEHHLSPFPNEWPLLPRGTIEARFPEFRIPEAWQDADWHTPPEEHDTALERAQRVISSLSERFAATPDVRVAIVSHGSPVGKLILAFARVPSTRDLTVTIENASLSVLYEGYGHRYVHAVNRTDHLGPLASPPVW